MSRDGEATLRLASLRPGVRGQDALLHDYALEIAELHGRPVEEVEPEFRRWMDLYHFRTDPGTPEEWRRFAVSDLSHTFVRISKPFRLDGAVVSANVLDAIAAAAPAGRPARVLDYGGGGGSDTIVYARSGHEAHYADMLALKNSDVVARRFALRGLEIPMHDGFDLPAVRYDAIAAIDVLEHLYDVELAIADLAARLHRGGVLCTANAFAAIYYDGDHHDKNRAYVELYPHLMAAIGFERVTYAAPLEIHRRTLEPLDDIPVEAARLRRRLYEVTREHAIAASRAVLAGGLLGPDPSWDGPPPAPAPVADGAAAAAPDRRAALIAAAGHHAPRALRRRVNNGRWDAKMDEVRRALLSPATPAEARGALADWTAVLRIAEARLAELPSVD